MKGICAWCHHSKMWHNGRVRAEVKAKPEFRNVTWSVSACSNATCPGCRKYEPGA